MAVTTISDRAFGQTVSASGNVRPFPSVNPTDHWLIPGDLSVAYTADGELTISGGGTVRNHEGEVAALPTTIGSVIVTGKDSSWINDDDLLVGVYGQGRLSISDGGLVENAYGYIALDEQSDSRVEVTGPHSRWINRGFLIIAPNGTGRLTVTDGGTVTSQRGHVASNPNSHGEVLVSGAGSLWDNDVVLEIGKEGEGFVAVEDGGTIRAPQLQLAGGSQGSAELTLKGTSAARGVIETGYMIKGSGAASIAFDGGILRALGDESNFLRNFAPGDIKMTGDAHIDSNGFDIGVAADLQGTGGLVKWGAGTLTLAGDNSYLGTTIVEAGILAAGGANAFVRNRAYMVNGGRLDLGGFDATISRLSGSGGVVDIHGADLRLDQSASSAYAGRLAGSGNFIKAGAGELTLSGDSSGFTGTTEVNGGALIIGATGKLGGSAIVGSGARLSGTGTVGTTRIEDGGWLTPGNSIGSLTIDGNLTLAQGARLQYELGSPGTASGPQLGISDRVAVRGNLTLNGHLDLVQSMDPGDGTAGIGYYRLMTYGGTLDGDGLTVATVPPSAVPVGYEILAGDGRVDLFIGATGDNILQHWQGGDGVWDGNQVQWINKDGAHRVAWAGNHAVFRSSPGSFSGGTVTVSGTHAFQGLQFLDEGYALTGAGMLETAASGGEIRVLADRAHIATAIGGTGAVTKTGGGRLVLSGENSYSGGTRLLGGVLQVSSDANLGNAGGGLIFNGGTLETTAEIRSGRDITLAGPGAFEVAAEAALELSGTITGAGQMLKVGGGALHVTGDGSGFTGQTTIGGGLLAVGGADGRGRLGGSLTVGADGTVGGTGTIGSGASSVVRLSAGGTVAPGHSTGRLTIDGDLLFESGARYALEAGPDGSADMIHVTGTAILNGGTVVHMAVDDNFAAATSYRILTAEAGLEGRFDDVSSVFAFLTPTLIYDYNNFTVDLELARNSMSFEAMAVSRNQLAVAACITALDNNHRVYQAIVTLPNDDRLVRQSFDALSGEIHASVGTALMEDSRLVRRAALGRVRTAFDAVGARPGRPGPDSDRFAAWAQALGNWGEVDSNGNAAAMDHSTGGFLMGADALFGDFWRVGFMVGYSETSFDVAARASSGSSDSYHLGLYGGLEWEGLGIRAGLAYSRHELETSRLVAVGGPAVPLTADYDTSIFQSFAELGYQVHMAPLSLEPFAGLAFLRFRNGGFVEQGGENALIGHAHRSDRTISTLGLRAFSRVPLGSRAGKLRGSVGWGHLFGDRAPITNHSFSNAESFVVAGAPLARNMAVVEAGFDLELTDGATLGLSYDGQLASGLEAHGFNAVVQLKF